MKKSNLRATAALQALALLGAGVPVAFFAAAPAAAQDYTQGVITGTVTGANGAQVPGASVTLQSQDQGFTRTTNTGANGQFTFTALPAGEYDVVVQSAGTTTFRADNVEVVPGRTSDLPIVLTAAVAGAAAGAEIVVVGRRIQAFTGTTTGATIDVEEITKTIPLGKTLTDIVLLAPGTVQGDASTPAFRNLASIGGASVAENAYYVNGLNITNFDNYLGGALVPFDFYKSVEVKSGGYPAEYGRATGGIVNAVSKRGTNDLVGALHVSFAPNFLRSNGRDFETCNADGSCDNITNRSEDTAEALTMVAEAGFPIIRDRLFVYGLLEMRRNETVTVAPVGQSATRDRSTDPFYAIKVDAFPLDNHHFEFTYFDTRRTTVRRTLGYSEPDGGGLLGDVTSTREFYSGGVNYVGRYTGRLTDWFTVSGAYGKYRDRLDDRGIGAGAGDAYVINASNSVVFGIANGGFTTDQRASGADSPYSLEREFYRADADVLVDFMGEHHFRFGFDRENNTLDHTFVRTGSDQLCSAGFLTAEACNANSGGAGAALLFRPADSTGAFAGVPIVEVNYFNSGGQFLATNTGYYLQDEWKTPLDGLTLNLGIRRDDFALKDPAGGGFITLKENWAPRLGFSYDTDLLGNRGRFFGSYGIYYLPIASNLGFRAVGAEYYIRERFYFTGLDANGLPILGAQVVNNGDYNDPCALNLTGVPTSTGANCNQTGDGTPKDATHYVATNLKPTKEAEFILGYRTNVMGLDMELAYTHRETKNLNEDSSLDQGILNYCEANGIDGCEDVFTGSHQFAIINVGKDVRVVVDAEGIPELNDKEITLTAAQLGYPKVRRTYDAFDFSFQRPFDGLWSFGGAYTLSWSKGNNEGFVNSDTGQDDAGALANFDFPGFSDNSYGYLPNDRRHKLKLYGAYALMPNLIFGANLSVNSPRKLSCFGFNPNSALANNYNAAYNHYCGGVGVKRGTAQKTQWVTQLDLSGRYNITVPTGQRLTLRADIFNVFNSRAVQYRSEIGDSEAQNYVDIGDPFGNVPTAFVPAPNYGLARAYQNPRYVRLGADLYFGGDDVAPPVLALAPPPPPPPPVAAPATQTCPDGSVILATDMCPAPPPPPPPPPPAPERG